MKLGIYHMERENKTLYVINKEYLLPTLIIEYKSDFELNLVMSSSNGTKIFGFDFLSILKFVIYLCIFNSFNPYIVETLVEKMTIKWSFEYTNQKIHWEIFHNFEFQNRFHQVANLKFHFHSHQYQNIWSLYKTIVMKLCQNWLICFK